VSDEVLLLPLLRAWHRALGSKVVTAGAVISEAARLGKANPDSPLWLALSAIASGKPYSKLAFAKWLAKQADKKVDGYLLTRSYSSHLKTWRFMVVPPPKQRRVETKPRPKREKKVLLPPAPQVPVAPALKSMMPTNGAERGASLVQRMAAYRAATAAKAAVLATDPAPNEVWVSPRGGFSNIVDAQRALAVLGKHSYAGVITPDGDVHTVNVPNAPRARYIVAGINRWLRPFARIGRDGEAINPARGRKGTDAERGSGLFDPVPSRARHAFNVFN
jgi:hypothetical protein